MEYIHIKVVDKHQKVHELELPNDRAYTLMEMLRASELPVLGTCGGMALCASCHIYVHSSHELPPMKEAEELLLDTLPNSNAQSRLSCQIPISDELDGLVCALAAE